MRSLRWASDVGFRSRRLPGASEVDSGMRAKAARRRAALRAGKFDGFMPILHLSVALPEKFPGPCLRPNDRTGGVREASASRGPAITGAREPAGVMSYETTACGVRQYEMNSHEKIISGPLWILACGPQFILYHNSMNEIRKARKKLGLSQNAMAQWLGVSQATFSRWESGKSRVPNLVLRHVAAAVAGEVPVPISKEAA